MMRKKLVKIISKRVSTETVFNEFTLFYDLDTIYLA